MDSVVITALQKVNKQVKQNLGITNMQETSLHESNHCMKSAGKKSQGSLNNEVTIRVRNCKVTYCI